MDFFKKRSRDHSSTALSLLHPHTYTRTSSSSSDRGFFVRHSNTAQPVSPSYSSYYNDEAISPCSPSPSSPLSISSYTYPRAPATAQQRSSTVTYAYRPSSAMSSDRESCAAISVEGCDDDINISNNSRSSSSNGAKKPTAWDRAASRIHRKTILEEAEKRRQSEEQQLQGYQMHFQQHRATSLTAQHQPGAPVGSTSTSTAPSSDAGARHHGGWFGGRVGNSSRQRRDRRDEVDMPAASASYDYDAWLREI